MDVDALLRSRAVRVAAVVGPLVVVTGVVALLAWQAHRADRRYRAAARSTVQDHLDFAASLLESELQRVMAGTMFYAFAPESRRSGAPPPPGVFLEDPQERDRCDHAYGPGERFFFRVSLPGAEVEAVGGVDPAVRTWLADTIPAHAASAYPTTLDYAHVFGRVEGGRQAVAYRLRRDDEGRPVAAYGFNTCFADREGPLLPRVVAGARVLPPSLTDGMPLDSLLSVEVTDPTGAVLYRSARAYDSDFTGVAADVGSDPFGGLRIAVTLRPEEVERLVIGGIPTSRLPFLLALVAVTGGLVAISLVQLLRTLELVRVRERFIDDVSHELRTPLQQILLFLQLVRLGKVRSEEERDRAVEIAEREAGRLVHLVENVLELRADRSDESAYADGAGSDPVELGSLVEEVLEAFEPLARGADCRVISEVKAGTLVAAPPDPIRQVLVNLLDNAVKYGPPGQTIRVRALGEEGRVTLLVDDQGPGVPTTERERVFRSFYRLPREVRSARGGSGIGLSVVRRLLERMGGRAWVEEGPGGGARVGVELPGVRDGKPAGTGTGS